jgi:hypothetical protein
MKTLPRIFHGPENICGIGRYLADWQREKKNAKSDFIVFEDHTNRQNSHRNLRLGHMSSFSRLNRQWLFFLHALSDYDLFHFYFGKSLLPLNLDLPILRIFGKKIIMNYAGSDIRLTKLEQKRNPYYHLRFNKKESIWQDFLKRLRMIWHGLWIDYCIAGRKLYIFAETSIPKRKILKDMWVNTTIVVPKKPPEFINKKFPMIIHAPTNPQTKGTKYVQAAIDALRKEELEFEFRIFHKIPHDEFINFLKNDADIVIDQLLSGGFGSLAMEGMSYGKPVCCYVTEDIWPMVPGLPIVQSTINTLHEQLCMLIKNPDKRKEIGLAGWEFAKAHYDRDFACEKLWQIYLDLWNKKK